MKQVPQLFLYKGEFCEGGIREKGKECERKEIYALRTEKPKEMNGMTFVGKLPLLSSEELGDACRDYYEMCIKYNEGKDKDEKIMPGRFDIEKNHSKIEVELFLSSQKGIIKKHADYLNRQIAELENISSTIA